MNALLISQLYVGYSVTLLFVTIAMEGATPERARKRAHEKVSAKRRFCSIKRYSHTMEFTKFLTSVRKILIHFNAMKTNCTSCILIVRDENC